MKSCSEPDALSSGSRVCCDFRVVGEVWSLVVVASESLGASSVPARDWRRADALGMSLGPERPMANKVPQSRELCGCNVLVAMC